MVHLCDVLPAAHGVGGNHHPNATFPAGRTTTWDLGPMLTLRSNIWQVEGGGTRCHLLRGCYSLPPNTAVQGTHLPLLPVCCHCHFFLYSNHFPLGLVPVPEANEHNFLSVSFLLEKRSTPFPQMAPCSKPTGWPSELLHLQTTQATVYGHLGKAESPADM